ncbi:MAG: redoxin domain-containing protein [Rubrivivax sp.]
MNPHPLYRPWAAAALAVLASLAAAVMPLSVQAAAVVGQPAPALRAPDLAGKPVNLADFKGKTVVLEWHNFGCPFVQKHYRSGNMQAMQKRFAADVVWLSINSTHPGHPDYQTPQALEKELARFGAAPTRFLMDESGAVGLAYGAKVTPHMYIIDPTGKVVYNGAIDDKRSANPDDVKTARNLVAEALEELRAGKPISNPVNVPYGCTIKYK